MTDMSHPVKIELDGFDLDGIMSLPERARGLVIFAHGSGSSRLSPRNQFVARVLNEAGLGTLLMDLLTPDEESRGPGELRFDIPLLASRLVGVTDWAMKGAKTRQLPIGYFGASTGAAAALQAAAERATAVRAVVSRGGRPDLAMESLRRVSAPTLLIVGGADTEVLELNRRAQAQLRSCELIVVPGATHLFEERGALAQVADLAVEWFARYLAGSSGPAEKPRGRARSPIAAP